MGQLFSSSSNSSSSSSERELELWPQPSLKKDCDGGADEHSTCTKETDTTTSCSDFELGKYDDLENTTFRPEEGFSTLLSPEQYATYSFAKAHNEIAIATLDNPSPNAQTYQKALYHFIQASSTFCLASPFAMSETLSFELDRTYQYALVLSNSISFRGCSFLDQASLNEELGILFAYFGRHRAALNHFQSAEDILFVRVTVPPRRILRCTANIAAACFALKDFRGTIRACRKTLRLYEFGACARTPIFAKDHELLVVSLHKMMGDSFLHLKEWDKALQNFHHALQAWPPAYPSGSFLLEEIYHSISITFAHQKKRHG